MCDVADAPFEGWTPPAYRVDKGGKVLGAQPGPLHNWGRWGHYDQRGTSNLLTRDKVRLAARLVRSGETYALGLPIGRGTPNVTNRPAIQHYFMRTSGDHLLGDCGPAGVQSADDMIVLPLQASTQLDGLAHIGAEDVLYNGYWAGLVTAQSGARRLGVHHQASGIVGRGVLLDVARVQELDPIEGVIDTTMLKSTAAEHCVEVRSGDILLVRTGFLSAWRDSAEIRHRRRQAGLDVSTLPWMAEKDVAMVAADNRTVEVVPSSTEGRVLPFHVIAIRDLGLLIGELFDLDRLAEACAADAVYEFLFIAMPLPVINAVGSPLNPVAVK